MGPTNLGHWEWLKKVKEEAGEGVTIAMLGYCKLSMRWEVEAKG